MQTPNISHFDCYFQFISLDFVSKWLLLELLVIITIVLQVKSNRRTAASWKIKLVKNLCRHFISQDSYCELCQVIYIAWLYMTWLFFIKLTIGLNFMLVSWLPDWNVCNITLWWLMIWKGRGWEYYRNFLEPHQFFNKYWKTKKVIEGFSCLSQIIQFYMFIAYTC